MNLNKDNIMVDLETFGTRPNSVMISLGAVRFNKDGIKDKFFINIDPKDSVALGHKITKSTLEWWKEQKPEVLKQSLVGAVPVKQAIDEFIEWYGPKSLPIWGNGAIFDIAILEWYIIETMGYTQPWKFWDIECYRTMAKLDEDKSLQPKIEGDAHNALYDAKIQALHIIEIWKAFN